MLNHKLLKVLLGILIVVATASANSRLVADDTISNRFEMLLQKAAQAANLDEVEKEPLHVDANVRTVHEESRFIQGYAFIGEYTGDDCNEPDFTDFYVVKLNECHKTNDKARSRKVRAWVTVRGNLGLTFNYWNDDQCGENWRKVDQYYLLNTCANRIKAWAGPLPPSPPAYLADSVGLYRITDNLQCLDSKDLWKDFHSAQFAPMNTCLKYHDTLIGRDRILVGCGDSGVHLQRFDSTDGSCSEGLVNRVYNPENVCLWYDFYGDDTIGFNRYRCH